MSPDLHYVCVAHEAEKICNNHNYDNKVQFSYFDQNALNLMGKFTAQQQNCRE